MTAKSCNCVLDRRGLLGRRRGLARRGTRRAGKRWPPTLLPATRPHARPSTRWSTCKDGNTRFVSQPQLCELDLIKQRASVAGGQAPWATILSCADSRVPPELVFGGRGLGELFVARNAGNLADTATIGTLEYGAAVLGSPLIVVLGHSRCGAVKAACEVVTDNATFPGSIGPMIDPIIPAALAVRGRPGDFFDNSTRESALRTARRLHVERHACRAGERREVANPRRALRP